MEFDDAQLQQEAEKLAEIVLIKLKVRENGIDDEEIAIQDRCFNQISKYLSDNSLHEEPESLFESRKHLETLLVKITEEIPEYEDEIEGEDELSILDPEILKSGVEMLPHLTAAFKNVCEALHYLGLFYATLKLAEDRCQKRGNEDGDKNENGGKIKDYLYKSLKQFSF